MNRCLMVAVLAVASCGLYNPAYSASAECGLADVQVAEMPDSSIRHLPVRDGEPLLNSGNGAMQPVQKRKASFSFGFDLMSSYVCRGAYQTGASIQPKIAVEYAGLEFSLWGSTDLAGTDMQEVDIALTYKYKGLKVALTDYYVSGNALSWGVEGPDGSKRRPFRQFFDLNSRTTPHVVELLVAYTVSEKFPLTVSWGTMLFGNDFDDYGRREFTSYFDLYYTFKVLKSIDMKAGIAGTPWATTLFKTSGFEITNIYLHASRTWEIKDSFKIGLLARVICNPSRDELNFVGGLAFSI